LQLTELYTAREKPINVEPTSHQFKPTKGLTFVQHF